MLVKEINYFTITYFSEIDDYYNSDKVNLQRILIEVEKIFRRGYIEVESRAIKMKASNGGSNDNEIYIDLQLEYFEDKEEIQEEIELIQSIELEEEE